MLFILVDGTLILSLSSQTVEVILVHLEPPTQSVSSNQTVLIISPPKYMLDSMSFPLPLLALFHPYH